MFDPNTVLRGFSRALYANWLLYKPLRILIDCGEGCATDLDGAVSSVERVFLTHGHIDHVGGLPTLLWTRAAGGVIPKSLEIFHSSDDPFMGPLFAYVEGVRELLPFPIEWKPLHPGSRVELRPGWMLEAFPTRHLSQGQSLGYRLLEQRTRIKPEFAGLTQNEISALAARDELDDKKEAFEFLRVAFCGDSLPVDTAHVAGAELLVHEATIFEGEGEKPGQNHSSLADALEVATRAKPKALLLNHLSRHHSRVEIETAIRSYASKKEVVASVWMLLGDQILQVDTST
ncbi:ribonuclease BN [Abditibacteriota bacterium]|nr:ribonuclease BN [Abditibacteriota bacterium]